MSVTVIEDPQGIAGERAVTITNSGNDRIHIHPWEREEHTDPRQVYIAVGLLEEAGDPIVDDHGDNESMNNEIVNRDDFIEALLAVFPEIRRA